MAEADNAMPDPRYALLYEEAMRILQIQEGRVEAVRNRAGTLLAAGSLSHSFLGGIALDAHGINAWAWMAFAFLVGLGGCVLTILWPTKGWLFRLGVQDLLGDYVEAEEPADIDSMHRELAWHVEVSFGANEEKLAELNTLAKWGSVLLILGTFAWFGDLAWGGP